MAAYVTHSRQFVISKRPIQIDGSWIYMELPCKFFLSYQVDLSLSIIKNRSGTFSAYLGTALPVQAGLAERFGRFCVLDFPRVYPDSSALMSLYYFLGEEGLTLTSSPSLAEQLGSNKEVRRALRWGSGIDWYPSPLSSQNGLRRMLRDQILDLVDETISFNEAARIEPKRDFEDARDCLSAGIRNEALGLPDNARLFLALTAGLDTRTLAAALTASGRKFECITQCFPEMDRADIEVAKKISRFLGVKHHVVGPSDAQRPDRRETWRSHTNEFHNDAENNRLFPGDQYRFMEENDILIRGGLFETGRRFYAAKLKGVTLQNATGAGLWNRLKDIGTDPSAIASLDSWLSWRRANNNGLDLVDSFYLDQRVGGWLASIEQALDLLPGRSVHLANCMTVLSALITPTEEDRKSGRLQYEAVRQLVPELLKFPINPVSALGLGKKVARKVTRLVGAWQSSLLR